jgi:hypothetical protein
MSKMAVIILLESFMDYLRYELMTEKDSRQVEMTKLFSRVTICNSL